MLPDVEHADGPGLAAYPSEGGGDAAPETASALSRSAFVGDRILSGTRPGWRVVPLGLEVRSDSKAP